MARVVARAMLETVARLATTGHCPDLVVAIVPSHPCADHAQIVYSYWDHPRVHRHDCSGRDVRAWSGDGPNDPWHWRVVDLRTVSVERPRPTVRQMCRHLERAAGVVVGVVDFELDDP